MASTKSTTTKTDDKLSYEEELVLGDKCVALRRVNDLLEREDREPTPEERKIIEEGNAATQELVQRYLPFITKMANTVFRTSTHGGSSSISSVDDLIQVGSLNAILRSRSFNPRGGGNGHAGVRFASYIQRDITKAMRSALTSGAMVMKVDPAKVSRTAIWNSTREGLQAKLGRVPKDEEIEQVTGFGRDKIFSTNYIRPQFDQIEDIAAHADSSQMALTQAGDSIMIEEDAMQGALRYCLAVSPHFKVNDVQIMIEMFGITDGVPKEREKVGSLAEIYPETFTKPFAAQRWFKQISARLTHPQYMSRIARSLQSTKPDTLD